ncbi:MAG: hypothetical protein ACOYD9_02560 [Pyramidobacter sp.]|jgi:hypothetical protein
MEAGVFSNPAQNASHEGGSGREGDGFHMKAVPFILNKRQKNFRRLSAAPKGSGH